MKKLITILFMLMLVLTTAFAQAPQKMSYQAVVRQTSGELVTEQNVNARISILQGSPTGAAVYVENHSATTNANGLLTIEIGDGTAVSGTFSQINWGNGPFYLKSEIDPEGGINYSIEGVQQLLSVPYALYAANCGNMPNITVNPTNNGYVVNIDGQSFTVLNGQDGAQGPAGPQGPQGEQGAQGPAGPVGPQGPQGEQGVAGPVGPQGEQGATGAQGPAGQSALEVLQTMYPNMSVSQLMDSLRGPVGPQGPQGAQGEQGIAGPVGPQGPQGEQGPAGPQGEQGESALQVLRTIYPNLTTEQLLDSLRGPQGPQGPAGADGTMTFADLTQEQRELLRGPVGPQGPQGEQGAQGIQGIAGPVGPQGPQGEQGIPGQDGVSPTIDVVPTDNGSQLVISNPDGTTYTVTVTNGQDADPNDVVVPIPPIVLTGDYSLSHDTVITMANLAYYGNGAYVTTGIRMGTDSTNMSQQHQSTMSTSGYATNGVFMVRFENLQANTTYYYQSFATNEAGTNYGVIKSFRTEINQVTGPQPCPGTPTVTDYEGNVYNTVQIGTQCWMKEDLRTMHYATGAPITTEYWDDRYPNGIRTNVGVLYTWKAATNNAETHIAGRDIQGVCPQGWHLPSVDEYTQLFETLGGLQEAFPKILATDGDWSVTATNESGFSLKYNPNIYWNNILNQVLPLNSVLLVTKNGDYQYTVRNSGIVEMGGSISMGTVRCVKGDGFTGKPALALDTLWPAQEALTANVRIRIFMDGNEELTSFGVEYGTSADQMTETRSFPNNSENSSTGHAAAFIIPNLQPNTTYYVRAFATNANGTSYSVVKTYTTPAMMNQPCPDAATVTDIEGNVYNTVQIGSQCWMKENLKTKHYATGSEIRSYNNDIIWPRYYANNSGDVLYSDAAVFNHNNDGGQGICPQGWHLPTEQEYATMFNTLGGVDAGIAKIKGSGWTANATNESGFSLKNTPCIYLDQETRILETMNYVKLFTGTYTYNYYIFNDEYTTAGENGEFGVVRCVKGEGATSIPLVHLDSAWSHTANAAEARFYVVNDGSSAITVTGLLITDPSGNTVTKNSTLNEIGASSYYFSGLQPNTTYTIKAFATNDNGTAYSEEHTITTPNVMNQACPGTPTVTDIDGNVYNTVQIGSQCWMREDLKVTRMSSGLPLEDMQTSNHQENTWPMYYRKPDGGLLYNYTTAVNSFGLYEDETIQGICPNGWHLPSRAEVETLISTLGGYDEAASALKSTTGWNNGTNASGFNAKPGTYFSYSYYGDEYILKTSRSANNLMINNHTISMIGDGVGYYNNVRCIKGEGNATAPYIVAEVSNIQPESATLTITMPYDGNLGIQTMGYSIGNAINASINMDDWTGYLVTRPAFTFELVDLQPNTQYVVTPKSGFNNGANAMIGDPITFTTPAVTMARPCPDAPMVSDIEGNWYNTVQIGNQCWMKENLRTKMFQNGTSIQPLEANAVGTDRYYAIPSDNGYNENIYGLFYSVGAVMNDAPYNYGAPIQGICPAGWHVPTITEWNELINAMNGDAAQKLGDNGQFWNNASFSNTSGFSARPAGYGYVSGSFSNFGSRTEFATANTTSNGDNFYVYIFPYSVSVGQQGNNAVYSVRCIKGDGATAFPPTVRTEGYGVYSYNKVDVSGTIINTGGGVTEKGVVYSSTNHEPTVNDTKVVAIGSGNTFSARAQNLDPAKTYYMRTYVKNDAGINYGETIEVVIMNVPCSQATVTDASGNSYNTVQIKGQCWMKSNLRTTKYPNGANIATCDVNDKYFYKHVGSSSNDAAMGLYYSWEAAMNGAPGNYNQPVQGICPDGWHIPTKDEFLTLLAVAGSVDNLKGNNNYWTSANGNNTNSTGFTLNPSGYAGYSCSSSAQSVGTVAELLTASQNTASTFYYMNTTGTIASQGKTSYVDAVRCIKGAGANNFLPSVSTVSVTNNGNRQLTAQGHIDNAGTNYTEKGFVYSYTNPNPTYNDNHVVSTNSSFEATFSAYPAYQYYVRAYVKNANDIVYGNVDTSNKVMNTACNSSRITYYGTIYTTVQIGGQCWLKENLRNTANMSRVMEFEYDGVTYHYPDVYAYDYWQYNANNVSRGVFYSAGYAAASSQYATSYAHSNQQAACPDGWHVPTVQEATELINFLGGSSVAGAKLKSATGWSTNGTNESGFNMAPSGYGKANATNDNYDFVYGTTNSYFWVSGSSVPKRFVVSSNNSTASFFTSSQYDLVPIRCMQDHVSFRNFTEDQTSHSNSQYTYSVNCSYNTTYLTEYYGPKTVAECGVLTEDNQFIPSSSTGAIVTNVSFNDNRTYYSYRPYIKLSDGTYYLGSSRYLAGSVIN